MNAANYPFHPVTEEEKVLIAKSTRKHLICKNKETGELYEKNPLNNIDWEKHHREYYDLNIEGTNWVDQMKQEEIVINISTLDKEEYHDLIKKAHKCGVPIEWVNRHTEDTLWRDLPPDYDAWDFDGIAFRIKVPDESNGVDYEEFLFSYKTIGDN